MIEYYLIFMVILFLNASVLLPRREPYTSNSDMIPDIYFFKYSQLIESFILSLIRIDFCDKEIN